MTAMKNNWLKHMGAATLGLLLLAGCTRPDDTGTPSGNTALRVRLTPEGMTDAPSAPDATIGAVTACRFEQEILREVIAGAANDDGTHTFRLTGLEGDLRFVATGDNRLLDDLQTGVTSLDDFLARTATTEALTEGTLTMTGALTLPDELPATMTASLRRSVARIDIATAESGVAVNQVTIRGLADRGYINALPVPATPDGAERIDFRKDYASEPLTNASATLLYVCEQTGPAPTVELIATFGGGQHRMTATLPATLERNRIYTLRVHGAGASATVTVETDGWESGEATDSSPARKGLVDTEASVLPDGVTVNETCDTVRVDYLGADFRLVLRAEADSQIDITGNIRDVTASVEPLTRSLQPVAAVTIASTRRLPNEARAYLYLDVHRGDLYSGRVVVVFEPNPILFEGLTFDEQSLCDFGRYVDGEVGRIVLPEGKIATLAFAEGEDPWLKLAEGDAPNALRLVAGWKPNDPKADGRTQEGRIVISDADGSHAESYTLQRINWGLPVVKIGGNWWCKYNLRGDATNFADQIAIANDPAEDDALADHLAACDADELLLLMGDQYQGGNRQGLPLRHNGTAFYYEGMQSSGQNFGTLDPTAMAPDGYRVPDYDDYAFFAGSDNYNIGGVGTRSYTNRNGDPITVRIIEREARFFGQRYGTVAFYEFTTDEGVWVLDGLGHQWDTTPGNISSMMLLLATHSGNSSSWIMEGYAQSVKPNQNWLKFVGQNATKTRVLRCIKTPVEYIYE